MDTGKNRNEYYPTYWNGCNPLHEVRDWPKVRSIIRSFRKDEFIPPILIDGDINNGSLLTGTHRSAANDIMLMLAERIGDFSPALIDYVTLDDAKAHLTEEEYGYLMEAVEELDYERINDLWDERDWPTE